MGSAGDPLSECVTHEVAGPKRFRTRACQLRSSSARTQKPLVCSDSFLWARLGSNQRPLACEASALPLSYAPGLGGFYAGRADLRCRPTDWRHRPRRRNHVRAVRPPSDPTCSSQPVFTTTTAVTGNGDFSSATFIAQMAGTYRWVAPYSGDALNTSVGRPPAAPAERRSPSAARLDRTSNRARAGAAQAEAEAEAAGRDPDRPRLVRGCWISWVLWRPRGPKAPAQSRTRSSTRSPRVLPRRSTNSRAELAISS